MEAPLRTTGLLLILLLAGTAATAADESPVPLSDYLEFARASADWTWQNRDSLINTWIEDIDADNVFGYRPPPRLLEMAVIYAFLFEKEGRKEYADRAAGILLTYDGYRKHYPTEAAARRSDYDEGVPVLPDFFTTMRYVRAYDTLKRLGRLDAAARKKCETVVAESINYTLRTQEWGAMNRSALRAETLAWAIRACPDHADADRWRTYERALGGDNWGTWEIEDASLYNAIWLFAMIGYADAKGEQAALFRTPEMYYYAHYFLRLMSPDDMIPDFGDANWRSNWDRYLVFFEAAATAYGDGNMKWAATRIARRFLDLKDVGNISRAYILLDCYRHGSDDVAPEPPTELSSEVMEDVVGKKIVCRTGWDRDATYLLLNYRDEGDGGLLYRDYLRDTIPVEEEKMTHGHSDENSIVLLMKNGSVLLHDGGYRNYMPSGPYGAYRQDYFHNRLCVRPEKIWFGQKEGEWRYAVKDRAALPGQKVLDFLHNAGSYRPVRTFKVDFLTFDDFDYSRTRVVDEKMGTEWDRVLVFLKDPGLFVVVDILKAREEGFYTACNLWHTRQILARGDHWYDTVYDRISRHELPTETRLLIHFPDTHFRLEGVEKEKRHYQDELVIHQTAAQHFELGQNIALVTLLIPHEREEDPGLWPGRIGVSRSAGGRGIAVTIEEGGRITTVGIKRDMRGDMTRDFRRPRYTFESGSFELGGFESNGDLFVATRRGNGRENGRGGELSYTVVNFTKALYEGRVLLDQRSAFFGLHFDGSADSAGIGKMRYWRDTVRLGEEEKEE
jgi:hypothetical protein